MPLDPKRTPPEAGADTDPRGRNPRPAASGGHRSPAGSDYGDYVPDRGQPRENDDRDAEPPMGDYYTGGGDIDQMAERPPADERGERGTASRSRRDATDSSQAQREETAHEANANKEFDTPHTHSSTTPRNV